MRSLLLTAVAVLALCRPALADPNEAAVDGIVTDSAALPGWGTVRLSGAGGTFGAAEGASGELGVLWTVIPTLALNVSGVLESNQAYDKLSQITPVIALRWQALSEERFGVNLTGTLRFKNVGFDPNSGELEAGVAVGHTFERFIVVGNIVAGHDTQAVAGTDLEVHGQTDYRLVPIFRVGLEGRFRTGRDPYNFPVFGSAWDLIAGPHAVVTLGPVRIQALAGVGGGAGPNAQLLGLGKPSPFGMLELTGDVH